MATGSKVASASFAGGAASAIPSGTLKISQNGTDYNVDIPANATLQTTRDAINKAQGANGISANIVTDSTGASRLVISSNKTGAGSDLTVSGIAGLEIDGTQPMGTSPAAGASGAVNDVAKDAKLTIDGLAGHQQEQHGDRRNQWPDPESDDGQRWRASGGATPTVVSVDANTKGLQASIQSFVDAYNTLKTTIDTLVQGDAGRRWQADGASGVHR